jgi:hypothetical protein
VLELNDRRWCSALDVLSLMSYEELSALQVETINRNNTIS